MSGSTPWRRKEHGIDRWSSVMFGKMCEVIMHKGNAFGHTIDAGIVPEHKQKLQKGSCNAFDCIVRLGRGFNKFPVVGYSDLLSSCRWSYSYIHDHGHIHDHCVLERICFADAVVIRLSSTLQLSKRYTHSHTVHTYQKSENVEGLF